MAITHIATTGKGLSIAGGVLVAFDTTGANLIVVSVSCAGSNTVTVTDNFSNTYSSLTRRTGSSTHSHQMFYAKSATVGVGHSITVSGSGIYAAAYAHAFAGTNTSSPFDVENGATLAAGTSSLSTGSITPSSNGALIITALSSSGTVINSLTPTMTQSHASTDGSGYVSASTGYLIQTTATAINPAWNWNSTSGGVAAVASFLPTAVTSAEKSYAYIDGIFGIN